MAERYCTGGYWRVHIIKEAQVHTSMRPPSSRQSDKIPTYLSQQLKSQRPGLRFRIPGPFRVGYYSISTSTVRIYWIIDTYLRMPQILRESGSICRKNTTNYYKLEAPPQWNCQEQIGALQRFSWNPSLAQFSAQLCVVKGIIKEDVGFPEKPYEREIEIEIVSKLKQVSTPLGACLGGFGLPTSTSTIYTATPSI